MSEENLVVDFDDLELGELEDFEEATGLDFTQMKPGKALPVKALTALVWIVKRRTEPDFTIEDARKMKLSTVDLGDANPTGGNS